MEDSVEAAFLKKHDGGSISSDPSAWQLTIKPIISSTFHILFLFKYGFPYCNPRRGHAYGFLSNIQNRSNF